MPGRAAMVVHSDAPERGMQQFSNSFQMNSEQICVNPWSRGGRFCTMARGWHDRRETLCFAKENALRCIGSSVNCFPLLVRIHTRQRRAVRYGVAPLSGIQIQTRHHHTRENSVESLESLESSPKASDFEDLDSGLKSDSLRRWLGKSHQTRCAQRRVTT